MLIETLKKVLAVNKLGYKVYVLNFPGTVEKRTAKLKSELIEKAMFALIKQFHDYNSTGLVTTAALLI